MSENEKPASEPIMDGNREVGRRLTEAAIRVAAAPPPQRTEGSRSGSCGCRCGGCCCSSLHADTDPAQVVTALRLLQQGALAYLGETDPVRTGYGQLSPAGKLARVALEAQAIDAAGVLEGQPARADAGHSEVLTALVDLVRRVRDAQRVYFRDRTSENLRAARDLEDQLDESLGQGRLF